LGIGGFFIAIFLRISQNHVYGSFADKVHKLDWVGTVLFLISITGFLIPISRGGLECPWSSWRTLVPLCVYSAGIIAFVIHQEYLATNPLVCTDVFKNRSAAIVFTLTVVYGLILAAVFFYLPLYFEAVKGMSPVMAGVAIFPWTWTFAPSAVVCPLFLGICVVD